eukprot:TRINITY_DN1645_c0_g1_i1.p1 TRINITY_DN1645_c0_g1~~TRINITY_DN1645_c0_g1_i1.p1  ORF type:complete len:1202 (+),score=426.97 TRINITY_DN1645_c0_g1_i1:72-3608(+)
MDQVLESVGDAVATLVLWAAEAEEKGTKIPDLLPGTEVVKSAVDSLLILARKSAQLWQNMGRDDMKEKMETCMQGIETAIDGLRKAASNLKADPFNLQGKGLLLQSCKTVMQDLVVLLQLADLYDVQKLIRLSNEAIRNSQTVSEHERPDSRFANLVTTFVQTNTEIIRLSYRRIKNIEGGTISDGIRNCAEEIKGQTDEFTKTMQKCFSDATLGLQEEKTLQRKHLIDVLTELIRLVKLTAKSPFDLSLLDGAEINLYPSRAPNDIEQLFDGRKYALEAYGNLMDAAKKMDSPRVMEAMRAIEKHLTQQMTHAQDIAEGLDDLSRAQILSASSRLENILRKLLELAADKNLNKNLQQIDGLLEDSKRAGQVVMATAARIQLENSQKRYAQLIEEHALNLNADKTKAAIDALRDITKEIGIMTKCAEEIMNDKANWQNSNFRENSQKSPEFATSLGSYPPSTGKEELLDDGIRVDRLREASEDLREIPVKIASSTRSLLSDPKNEKFSADHFQILDEAKNVALELLECATMTTPQSFLQRAAALDLDLDKIKILMASGDLVGKRLAELVKIAGNSAIRQTDLGGSVIYHLGDTPLAQKMTKAMDRLQNATQGLISATKVLFDKETPESRKLMENNLQEVSTANIKALEVIDMDKEDQLLLAEQDVLSKLSNIGTAIKDGDVNQLKETHKLVPICVQKQGMLAKAIFALAPARMVDEVNRVREQLELQSEKLADSIFKLEKDVGNDKLRFQVEINLENMKREVQGLTSLVSMSEDDRAVDGVQSISKIQRNLQKSIREKVKFTPFQLEELNNDLSRAVKSQISTTRHLSARDSKLDVRQIDESCQAMSRLVQDVKKASSLTSNPIDLQNAVDAVKRASLKLLQMSHPQVEFNLKENGTKIEKALENTLRSVKYGKDDQLFVHHRNLDRRLDLQKTLLESLEDRVPENEKKILGKVREDLEQAQVEISQKVQGDIRDQKCIGEIARAAVKVRDRNSEGMKIVREIAERRLQREERMKEIEKSVPDREVEHAAENLIQTAEDISGQYKMWNFEATAEDDLFLAGKKVGELMVLLSQATAEKSRAKIIEISRKIADASKHIVTAANEQASRCRHELLKSTLLVAVSPVQQIAIQLKIITAVKAATGETSVESLKTQLVKCAKALVQAIIKTMEAALVAAIKT